MQTPVELRIPDSALCVSFFRSFHFWESVAPNARCTMRDAATKDPLTAGAWSEPQITSPGNQVPAGRLLSSGRFQVISRACFFFLSFGAEAAAAACFSRNCCTIALPLIRAPPGLLPHTVPADGHTDTERGPRLAQRQPSGQPWGPIAAHCGALRTSP